MTRPIIEIPQMEAMIQAALFEDLGLRGDITSQAVIASDIEARAVFLAKESGRLCGLKAAQTCFRMLDQHIQWQSSKQDGCSIQAGDVIASVAGNAQAILAGERLALNLLTRLCGIASATASMVARADGVRICCTRKTTPNLRALEKYAVRCGGGHNHRFGLDDGVLIKDNHLTLISVAQAVAQAKQHCGHLTKIEVEANNLSMVEEIIQAGADAVLLDNMTPDQLRQAVALIDGRMMTEASGRIDLDNVAEIATTGVDVISSGWLTHSASGLDIGLEMEKKA